MINRRALAPRACAALFALLAGCSVQVGSGESTAEEVARGHREHRETACRELWARMETESFESDERAAMVESRAKRAAGCNGTLVNAERLTMMYAYIGEPEKGLAVLESFSPKAPYEAVWARSMEAELRTDAEIRKGTAPAQVHARLEPRFARLMSDYPRDCGVMRAVAEFEFKVQRFPEAARRAAQAAECEPTSRSAQRFAAIAHARLPASPHAVQYCDRALSDPPMGEVDDELAQACSGVYAASGNAARARQLQRDGAAQSGTCHAGNAATRTSAAASVKNESASACG